MFIKCNKTKGKNGKVYESYLLVRTVRAKNGKKGSRHETVMNLTKYTPEQREMIRAIHNKEILFTAKENVEPVRTSDYGDIMLIKSEVEKLPLGKKYKKELESLIINRILEPKSKDAMRKRWYGKTVLPKIYNADHLEKNDIYQSIDELEDNQKKIEDILYSKREKKPSKIFYDITSSYFEGKKCPLAKYGYSRDKRIDLPQVVIGLLTDEEGMPIAVESYEGNTKDSSTVLEHIKEMKQRFDLEKVVLVGDRGMYIECNLKKLQAEGQTIDHIEYITAIRRDSLYKLAQKKEAEREEQTKKGKGEQISLFESTEESLEIIDDEKRYVIIHNPLNVESDKKTRETMLQKTENAFERIQNALKSGNITTEKELWQRIGKWKDKWHVGNCFIITAEKEKISHKEKEKKKTAEKTNLTFSFKRDPEAIEKASKLDGKWAIVSNTKKEEFSKENLIQEYKNLDFVEKAFETLKDDIKLRPIFHYKENRVRGHIFLCFLAYYVIKQLKKKLTPLLQEKNLSLKDIFFSFQKIKLVTEKFTMNNTEATVDRLTEISDFQQKVLDILNISFLRLHPL